ncbi:MAG TPA: citramalate synthase [Polyangia bacterium]|jgi:2-isopropylmalate synthase|nr:citramalate synthase [Polyangia bacterium]
MDVQLFDSTLRDGTQSEGLSLSVEDKLKITRLLDGFGIHYIEGGYPGSNPKDVEFFQRAKSLSFRHAKLTAFGMTRKPGGRAESDPILQSMVAAQTPAVAVVGKTWTLHVTKIVGTTLEENLAMVADSVAFLKQQGREVVFDCEHFFDGFRADRDYALAVVKAASGAGADWIAMCDTNGGSLPQTITEVVGAVRKTVPTPLGIHPHNDSDVAVANAFAGVEAGCTQVQGTMNGWGERCGNANLISVIPGLQLKMGRRCVPDENLARLSELSRAVSEIANIRPRAHAPYVGHSAFAHKGGMHVAAVEKIPASYEHIVPERVGNRRHIVVSELSGRGNVRMRAGELGIDVQGNERRVLEHIKELESQGYQFEAAEGSFELLGRRSQPSYVAPFDVLDLVVISERRRGNTMFAEATVKLKIGEEIVHEVAEGTGPVHALDGAFHKALNPHFPVLRDVRLADYKVRILDPDAATGAKTRVLIEAARGEERWSTIGVSQNIIEASATALADALELPLARLAAAPISRSAAG